MDEAAAGVGFGAGEAAFDERFADAEVAVEELDVFPAQGEQFAAAQGGAEGDEGECARESPPLALFGVCRIGFELGVGGPEVGDLGFGEDVEFGLVEAGAVAVADGVVADQAPADGAFEHHLQHE